MVASDMAPPPFPYNQYYSKDSAKAMKLIAQAKISGQILNNLSYQKYLFYRLRTLLIVV